MGLAAEEAMGAETLPWGKPPSHLGPDKAVWPWAASSLSLGPRILMWQVGIVIATSQRGQEDQELMHVHCLEEPGISGAR